MADGEVVILGDDGTEHVFPPGFDPKRAAAIVRGQTSSSAQPTSGDSPLSLVTGAARVLNPLPAINAVGQALLPAKAGFTGPVQTMKQIGAAQGALFDKAKAAYQQGDYVTAARHFVDYLLPIVGPGLDVAADKMTQGRPYEGAGEAIGIGLSLFGPKALEQATVKVPGVGGTKNATEAEAIRAGQAAGIPVDATTATGNRAVKAVQHLADRSLAGSVVAERAAKQTSEALTRRGESLASAVHPEAVTAEQAGTEVRGAITDLIRQLHGQANDAYGRLREIEANTPVEVAKPIEISGQMKARMLSTLGGKVATQAELQEMRNIGEELGSVPYSAGKLVADAEGIASDTHYVPRSANAPVYHDILQAAPGTSKMTGKQMQRSIQAAIDSGTFNNAARGALAVARERLKGSRAVSSAMLVKPGEATVTAPMLLPVDVGDVQAAVKPIYDQLKRESALVPLHGGKAQTLVALDRLINSPRYVPLSVADGALSDLKAMARSPEPDIRSAAQGKAAFAVKQLEQAVQHGAVQGGEAATSALAEGRAATAAKYAAAAVRDSLREEPVRAFRQLTAPKDSAVQQLRQVAELAPAEMPKIGRAVLEDMLGQATEAGSFDHAAKLYADWQRLGPQTKQMLFGSQAPEIEKFFLLAKKLSETPNPSGTAHTLAAYGQVAALANPYTMFPAALSQLGAGAVAALLHSPRGVKLLTQGASLSLSRAPLAVQSAAIANLFNVARSLGQAGATTQ